MKEWVFYLLLDWYRFSQYTFWSIVIPRSQSKQASDNAKTNQNLHYSSILCMKQLALWNPRKFEKNAKMSRIYDSLWEKLQKEGVFFSWAENECHHGWSLLKSYINFPDLTSIEHG